MSHQRDAHFDIQRMWWVAVVPFVLALLNRLDLAGTTPLWILMLTNGHAAVLPLVFRIPRVQRRLEAVLAAPQTPFQRWTDPLMIVLCITLCAYGIGWGPVLVPSYIAATIMTMSIRGSHSWRPAAVWSMVAIAAGQVAIQLGWVFSYVEAPGAHAVAVLGALAVLFVTVTFSQAGELRERAERRLDALIQNSSDMVTVCDASGVVTYQSDSVRSVLGREPDALLGTLLTAIVHPDDVHGAALVARDGGDSAEMRLLHADGDWRWCEARIANLLDDPLVEGIVLNTRDVTERKMLEDRLRHQAFHDPLTGLANRRLFADRLERAVARQSRSGNPMAVLLIDLDEFKQVNDTLGHEAGDEVLAQVAARLETCIRATDTVARLGGDEFAVVLEECADAAEVDVVCARILASLAEGVEVEGRRLSTGASIGAVMAEPWSASGPQLMRNADVAMYAAKERGKRQSAWFEPGMDRLAQERQALRNELVEAVVSGDQMILHYQPVVDLASGTPVGLEALVRWDHPRRGTVPPLDFIPIAEDTGLIVPIGRWVLAEACRQATIWNHDGARPVTMSVNISGRQLEDRSLLGDVRGVLADTGLDPHLLILEVTESVLMQEPAEAIAVLRDIRALGVRIAIDDFGTGYSSLGYLHELPVDILKVDRCFVQGLRGESEQAALAQAVLVIGRTLGLETVAEGIEDEVEADQLRELGCMLGQGFLFSRPMPPAEVAEWLLGPLVAPGPHHT